MFSATWSDTNSPLNPVSAMDYLPREQLRTLQLHRLKSLVEHTYANVELFRRRMDERGLRPAHIQRLEDIALLPFTIKADLRDTYPFGLFARPLKDLVRFHASSGTTGKPIVVAYTRNDINVWRDGVMRSLAASGCIAGDIVQNAYGYGLFTGGLGLHYGAESIGAIVVPVSGGNSERQIMFMRDFGSTVVCCTPSYFLHLIETARQLGIDMRELPLRIGIFGAEPWTDEMRRRIEAEAGITAYDIYGLSEICGPGVANECQCQNGLHVFEDHFYPEIIDPETLEPLPDGTEGELVFTTLTKEAMPIIRYRTRDLSCIEAEPCPCGRTIRRIRRISARSDDMLIIRGVNVFPTQIEAALLAIDETLPHYGIILTRTGGLDQLEIQVEVTKQHFSDEVRSLETLRQRIGEAIFRIINIRARVTLVEPNTIPRSEGKARRVRDLRQQ